VVLSRANGVDLVSGAGLDDALAGADAVVDVSNLGTTNAKRVVAFFDAGTRHLLAAEERAGVRHHVALSIVGIDRVDFGYYVGKRRQEELALGGPIDATVLRTTQFHEFAAQALDRGRGPVVVVPRMRIQPVAASEVAGRLVELVLEPVQGYAPELAGPQEEDLPDLVRRLMDARGARKPMMAVKVPGKAGDGMRDGALLPTTTTGPRGELTFAAWLEGSVVSGGSTP
jgi:uncharacterized protein YbjT (DUF2867 family)